MALKEFRKVEMVKIQEFWGEGGRVEVWGECCKTGKPWT